MQRRFYIVLTNNDVIFVKLNTESKPLICTQVGGFFIVTKRSFTMSKLSLCEIQQSQLDKTPIVDGQLVCCLDTGNTYRDTAGGRVRIGSDLERVSELPLAPLAGKIYYLPPGDLYIYNSGWVMLNDTDFTIGASKADATEANLELKHGDIAKGTVKVRGTGITSVTADADGRLIINTPNPEAVIDEITNTEIDNLFKDE